MIPAWPAGQVYYPDVVAFLILLTAIAGTSNLTGVAGAETIFDTKLALMAGALDDDSLRCSSDPRQMSLFKHR